MAQLTSDQANRAFAIVAPAINQVLRPKGTDVTVWQDYDSTLVILVFDMYIEDEEATFDNSLVWETNLGTPSDAKSKLREDAALYAREEIFHELLEEFCPAGQIDHDEGDDFYVIVGGVAANWRKAIASWILATCLAITDEEAGAPLL